MSLVLLPTSSSKLRAFLLLCILSDFFKPMAEAREIQLNQGNPNRTQDDSFTLASFNDHVMGIPQRNNATLPFQLQSQPTKLVFILSNSILKQWRWWIVVFINIVSVLAGETVATLLGRFYFNKGGNSIWMATMVHSAGAPFLIFPLLLMSKKSSVARPPLCKIVPIYIVLGLMITGDNLMYSYGLLYLPVSTYSLISSTQLGFNAIFSYFINKQKFTALIFNSVVLLTFSAILLGVNTDSSDSSIPKDKHPLGFVLTVAASATFALLGALMQLAFKTVIKAETFLCVLELETYSNIVGTLATVVGLLISGEWKDINAEFQGYKTGKASYALTLVGTAVCWQFFYVGLIGLISMVSSLFANVISTFTLPLVPVFAVLFFHDSMNGVKIVSLLIAVWGFCSYIYQHYIDDSKAKKIAQDDSQKDISGDHSLP